MIFAYTTIKENKFMIHSSLMDNNVKHILYRIKFNIITYEHLTSILNKMVELFF